MGRRYPALPGNFCIYDCRSRVEVMQDIERAVKKLKENDCNMVDNVLNNGAGEKD